MKKMSQLCLILLLSISSLAEVIIAVEDSWPPYANKDGSGISNDLVKEAFKSVGVDVKLKVVPYARALDLTKKGVVSACFNVTREESTEKEFLFGKEVLLKAPASFYFIQGMEEKFSSVEQLPKGFKVGVIRGYEYGDEFYKNKVIEKHPVANQEQLVGMLLRGRVDAIIMFNEVANFTLAKMNIEDKIKKGFLNHESRIFVAFSKIDLEKSKSLALKLDLGLKAIRESGLYEEIFKKPVVLP